VRPHKSGSERPPGEEGEGGDSHFFPTHPRDLFFEDQAGVPVKANEVAPSGAWP
jgi:hypothetical protein